MMIMIMMTKMNSCYISPYCLLRLLGQAYALTFSIVSVFDVIWDNWWDVSPHNANFWRNSGRPDSALSWSCRWTDNWIRTSLRVNSICALLVPAGLVLDYNLFYLVPCFFLQQNINLQFCARQKHEYNLVRNKLFCYWWNQSENSRVITQALGVTLHIKLTAYEVRDICTKFTKNNFQETVFYWTSV